MIEGGRGHKGLVSYIRDMGRALEQLCVVPSIVGKEKN